MAVRKRTDYDGWIVDIMIEGKRYRETFTTKREALAKERELIVGERSKEASEAKPETITFLDFMQLYLPWSQANKSKRTYENEVSKINVHLVPFFGKLALNAITAHHVERYKLTRHRVVSPRTVNIELTLMSVIFRQARKWGHVQNNPITDVEKMKRSTRPPRFLSQGEVRQLLAEARKTYLYPLVLCALHTGMRKSELFNLKWEDVDFERGVILVQSKDDWHTKNYEYRSVEMTRSLKETLQTMDRESDYVFTYGGSRLRSNITKSLHRILKAAGIENCTLHTLRHTFASHLAMQGVPLMHIQQMLGHQDYDTTLVYAHLSKESLRGQVQKLPFDEPNEDA